MSDAIKSEKKAVTQLILKTFVFLGLLTCVNAVFIVNAVGLDVFEPLKRNLASVQPDRVQPQLEGVFSPKVRVDCRSKTIPEVRTKASSARIIFENCGTLSDIINKTNGNQGDLFAINNQSSTTDFILLNDGMNQIHFATIEGPEVLVIHRENLQNPESTKAL